MPRISSPGIWWQPTSPATTCQTKPTYKGLTRAGDFGINEEKTELEKDYERIKKELIPEKEDENKIKYLENQIEIYKITLNNISSDISRYKQNLRNIVNSKEFSHKKIQKLKEVI